MSTVTEFPSCDGVSVTEFLALRVTSPHGDDDRGELTEPAPEPETGGDAGAAAFLHGPQGLFGSVATPDTPEDDRDDQVHGGGEMAAR